MIESIEFKNFKALRDTTLPLGPLTILVGPNGSGKSTVLQALELLRQTGNKNFTNLISFGALVAGGNSSSAFEMDQPANNVRGVAGWLENRRYLPKANRGSHRKNKIFEIICTWYPRIFS